MTSCCARGKGSRETCLLRVQHYRKLCRNFVYTNEEEAWESCKAYPKHENRDQQPRKPQFPRFPGLYWPFLRFSWRDHSYRITSRVEMDCRIEKNKHQNRIQRPRKPMFPRFPGLYGPFLGFSWRDHSYRIPPASKWIAES